MKTRFQKKNYQECDIRNEELSRIYGETAVTGTSPNISRSCFPKRFYEGFRLSEVKKSRIWWISLIMYSKMMLKPIWRFLDIHK